MADNNDGLIVTYQNRPVRICRLCHFSNMYIVTSLQLFIFAVADILMAVNRAGMSSNYVTGSVIHNRNRYS